MEEQTEIFELTSTEWTPYILLNKKTGEIEIRGISVPENTFDFYWHFVRELSEYTSKPAKKTSITIALKHLNSSSTQVITNFLTSFDSLIGMKTEINIKWIHEQDDEDMLELGEFFQTILKSHIDLISV